MESIKERVRLAINERRKAITEAHAELAVLKNYLYELENNLEPSNKSIHRQFIESENF